MCSVVVIDGILKAFRKIKFIFQIKKFRSTYINLIYIFEFRKLLICVQLSLLMRFFKLLDKLNLQKHFRSTLILVSKLENCLYVLFKAFRYIKFNFHIKNLRKTHNMEIILLLATSVRTQVLVPQLYFSM